MIIVNYIKKYILIAIIFLVYNNVSADDSLYFPNYSPDSAAFFSSELQNALSIDAKWNIYATMFVNMYGATVYGQIYDGGISGLVRFAASVGAIIPAGDYLSLNAFYTHVEDDADTAVTVNYFAGGGLIGNFNLASLGLFVGYYNNKYTNYEHVYHHTWLYDGYWAWDEVSSDTISNIRIALAPKIGLSSYVFFIDNISGYFNFNNEFDMEQWLAKLAFSILQIGATRLGIDLYFKQEPYNIIVEHQTFGASFETEYLKIDAGYRRFINFNDTGIYKDGVYGRIIGKIPIKRNYLLLSASIERNINWIPTFGIGYVLSGGVQALVEGGFNDGFGFNAFFHYDVARAIEWSKNYR